MFSKIGLCIYVLNIFFQATETTEFVFLVILCKLAIPCVIFIYKQSFRLLLLHLFSTLLFWGGEGEGEGRHSCIEGVQKMTSSQEHVLKSDVIGRFSQIWL
jgi:hypothetical protein